jgi:hypothetical protein
VPWLVKTYPEVLGARICMAVALVNAPVTNHHETSLASSHAIFTS